MGSLGIIGGKEMSSTLKKTQDRPSRKTRFRWLVAKKEFAGGPSGKSSSVTLVRGKGEYAAASIRGRSEEGS